MDATHLRAANALFLMCLAVFARNAHAGPTRACTIVGTPGRDVLIGTNGDDVICGLGGNDIIDGRGGNDVIYGGPGNDLIDGGLGNDVIYGGPGNDRIDGGLGHDTIYGGPGNDIVGIADGQADFADGGPGRNHAYYDSTLDKLKRFENAK